MTDDLVSRWERLLAADTTAKTFSVRVVAMREALDHIKALTAERDQAWKMVAEADTRLGQALGDAIQDKADNARLREAVAPLIVIALDNLDGMDAETREECERDIAKARAALNTGKEVMPPVPVNPANQSDIGPGDQGAVAGAAWDAILHGLGVMLDGQHVPLENFYAFPQGLFHLTGDTLGLRCATNGCGQHVSVRLERDGVSTDYCEPCGLKAVRT